MRNLIFTLVCLPLFAVAQIQASNNYTPPPPQPQTQQSSSQSQKAQLEAERRKLQEAIVQTERELAEIKNNKKATLGQLRALQYKLAQRQQLIRNINDEIGNIDQTIAQSSNEILTLKQQLALLKERYTQSIRYSYSNRSSYDMLAFLFSSGDFNDALRRMKYLKKFRDYRKLQVNQILETQTKITRKIDVLNKEKEEKDQLLSTQKEQSTALLGDVQETNNTIKDLKGREAELQSIAEQNRKKAAKINKIINDIIAREMEAAARKAREEEQKRIAANKPPAGGNVKPPTGNGAPPPSRTPKKPSDPVELMLTPTDIALANNFEGNKGKLYWPVTHGTITDHFGTHPSPLSKYVEVNQPGVDIRTSNNASVRAVFEGVVASVSTVMDKTVVLIRHGNYFSVYSNLTSSNLTKGDVVKTLQTIGVVATNEDGEPTLNFQIWKAGSKGNAVKMDPEAWISRLH